MFAASRRFILLPTGVAGVKTIYIPKINKTLAISFFVPFFCRTNYWNAKLFDGKQNATKKMYKEMMKKENRKEGNLWFQINLGNGLKLNGFMTNGGKAKLVIHVFQDK